MTNHVPNLNCMMMSTVVYEGLPEEYQNIIKEAADASTQYTRELSDSYSETQLKLSQDNGVEVIDLGEETLVEMREACADVYTLIKDQIGEELYQQILAVAGLN